MGRERVTRTLGGECGDAARVGIRGGVREDASKDEEKKRGSKLFHTKML